jgi:hypothetical protein
MLKAWARKAEAGNLVLLVPMLIVIFGLVTVASAAGPTVPWATGGTLQPAEAAVGVWPKTQPWGPSISFSLANGASFNSITPYLSQSMGTLTLTPAQIALNAIYAGASSTTNVGGSYPGGPSVQPGGSAAHNVNNTGFVVGSAVTSIVGGLTTDPYSQGTKISLSNPNDPGFVPGTNAAIIAGNVSSTQNGGLITMQWRTRSAVEMDKSAGPINDLPPNGGAAYLASDVMQLTGQKGGQDYVLQMDFSNLVDTPADQVAGLLANKDLYLGDMIGNSVFVNAVTENISDAVNTVNSAGKTISQSLPAIGAFSYRGSGSNNASVPYGTAPSQADNAPYIGSFQSFLNSSYLVGSQTHYFYEHSLDQLRGTWGIDTSTDTAWAILDCGNGIFAVVPEPASIRLAVGAMFSLAIGYWWRRRARVRAAKSVKVATA